MIDLANMPEDERNQLESMLEDVVALKAKGLDKLSKEELDSLEQQLKTINEMRNSYSQGQAPAALQADAQPTAPQSNFMKPAQPKEDMATENLGFGTNILENYFPAADRAFAAAGAGVGSALDQGSYDDLYYRNRNRQKVAADKYSAEHPTESALTGLTASILSPLSIYGAGTKAATSLGRVMSSAGRSGVIGSLYGAADSSDLSNPIETGGKAAVGAGLGAAFGAVGQGIGEYAIKPVVQKAAQALSRIESWGSKIADALPEGMLPDIQAKMQESAAQGVPSIVADTFPSMRKMAVDIGNMSHNSADYVFSNVLPNVQDSSKRLTENLDKILLSPQDYVSSLDDYGTMMGKAGEAIEIAKSQNVATKVDDLGDQLAKAMKSNKIAPAREKSDLNEAYDLFDALGGKKVSLADLHDLKTTLRSIMDKPIETPSGAAKMSYKTGIGRALVDVEKQLTKRMGDLSPDYKAANGVFSRAAKQQETAVDAFGSFMKDSPAIIKRNLSRLSEEQGEALREAYKVGAKQAIIEKMGQLGDEADVFSKFSGSEGVRNRLKALGIAPDDIDYFLSQAAKESELNASYKALKNVGGSPFKNSSVNPSHSMEGNVAKVLGSVFAAPAMNPQEAAGAFDFMTKPAGPDINQTLGKLQAYKNIMSNPALQAGGFAGRRLLPSVGQMGLGNYYGSNQ